MATVHSGRRCSICRVAAVLSSRLMLHHSRMRLRSGRELHQMHRIVAHFGPISTPLLVGFSWGQEVGSV